MAKLVTSPSLFRYITPPLLLGGRKFDIRVYMLVVAAQPYVVLYGDGYVRLSCASYNAASHDLTVHLTNQFQQKKHPDYSTMREDTVRTTSDECSFCSLQPLAYMKTMLNRIYKS